MLKYRIFEKADKDVCVPSTDYYRRSNDWSQEEILVLRQHEETFDSIDECIEHIKTQLSPEVEYLILPTFTAPKEK